jgi:hypothetical protein
MGPAKAKVADLKLGSISRSLSYRGGSFSKSIISFVILLEAILSREYFANNYQS